VLPPGEAGFDQARAVDAKQGQLARELGAYVSGCKPHTFLAPGESAEAAFSGWTLTRLREIKRARDPHDVFRADFPILG
jgi:hypothetical protein